MLALQSTPCSADQEPLRPHWADGLESPSIICVKNLSACNVCLQIISKYGWTGLYRGLEPALLGTAISQGVYFYFYSSLRWDHLLQPHLLGGAVACYLTPVSDEGASTHCSYEAASGSSVLT